MAETIQTNNDEVTMGASGKRLTYNGVRWYREDLYDRQSKAILAEQWVVRDLKEYVEYLRNLLNEAGEYWKVMDHE